LGIRLARVPPFFVEGFGCAAEDGVLKRSLRG